MQQWTVKAFDETMSPETVLMENKLQAKEVMKKEDTADSSPSGCNTKQKFLMTLNVMSNKETKT